LEFEYCLQLSASNLEFFISIAPVFDFISFRRFEGEIDISTSTQHPPLSCSEQEEKSENRSINCHRGNERKILPPRYGDTEKKEKLGVLGASWQNKKTRLSFLQRYFH